MRGMKRGRERTVTQHTVVVQLAASDFATRFSREGCPGKRRRRATPKERQKRIMAGERSRTIIDRRAAIRGWDA